MASGKFFLHKIGYMYAFFLCTIRALEYVRNVWLMSESLRLGAQKKDVAVQGCITAAVHRRLEDLIIFGTIL